MQSQQRFLPRTSYRSKFTELSVLQKNNQRWKISGGVEMRGVHLCPRKGVGNRPVRGGKACSGNFAAEGRSQYRNSLCSFKMFRHQLIAHFLNSKRTSASFHAHLSTLCISMAMAERGGFEPPEACASAVFKTAALNHSTISPDSGKQQPYNMIHFFFFSSVPRCFRVFFTMVLLRRFLLIQMRRHSHIF